MRGRIILFLGLFAIAVFVGAALVRSSRLVSALRLENVALRQRLQTHEVESNGARTDFQRTVPVGATGRTDDTAVDAAEDVRRYSLTNLSAENAFLQQKLDKLEGALAEQQSNRNFAATAEAARESSQIGSGAPSIDSNEKAWTEEQLQAYRCANQVGQINIAATLWAEAHGGFGPTNLYELHEYLAPMMLVCPGKEPKSIAHSWKNFDLSTISYRTQEPGVKWNGGRVYFMCPYHEIVSMNSLGVRGIPSKYEPKF
jgi:hypothetical protein